MNITADVKQITNNIANWNISTYVLKSGQFGFAVDANRFKIGDGIHTWIQLPYPNMDEVINALTRIEVLEETIVLKADQIYVDNKFTQYTKTIDLDIFIENSIKNNYVKKIELENLVNNIFAISIDDSLNSNSITRALSANQGRVLNNIKANRTEVPILQPGNGISISQIDNIFTIINNLPNIETTIVDDLNSTSINSALSANQGRVIKNILATKLNINDLPPIIDNLNSISSTSSLSARQGKILNDRKAGRDELPTIVDFLIWS